MRVFDVIWIVAQLFSVLIKLLKCSHASSVVILFRELQKNVLNEKNGRRNYTKCNRLGRIPCFPSSISEFQYGKIF